MYLLICCVWPHTHQAGKKPSKTKYDQKLIGSKLLCKTLFSLYSPNVSELLKIYGLTLELLQDINFNR